MQIAKFENNTITLGDYKLLFPDTSFHPSGPTPEFLAEHGCYPVSMWREFDRSTHKLEQVEPYLDGDTVYTVKAVPLTNEELAENDKIAKAEARREVIAIREEAVARIRVTTSSGKTFDGDETSQTRMARAVVALQAAGQTETLWVLADNTPATVSLDELAEALALAGAEQTRLWVSA